MIKEELYEELEKEGINFEIIEAIKKVDRKDFVPPTLKESAYENAPLPIGHGQTISQPYIVALMLQKLELKKGEKVLEIGTGSGWNAALISKLVGKNGEVYTIERIKELYEEAKKRLLTFKNVQLFYGDGSKGLREYAPFDKIIITAAISEIPLEIKEQLKEGGMIIAPVGSTQIQKLVRLKKIKKGYIEESICDVVFVPLIKNEEQK
ncbi:MAG: protein-L-isoaspartate(D-aspartate) O-methyltransferase [Candidatus Pacearchaeota archaeon]